MKKFLNTVLVFACVLACVGLLSSCLGTKCASHTDMDSNGLCDVCGTSYRCSGHADVNSDGMCDYCLAMFSCTFHYDQNADLKCDTCGVPYICPGHTDTDADGYCDTCVAPYTCPGHCDVNIDGFCDECAAEYVCPGHKDVDLNSKCDICKALWACSAHKDSNADGVCDYCDAEFECAAHVDAGSDGRCDRCDAPYICPGHVDKGGDNKCDICLGYYKTPEDFRAEFTKAAAATDPSVLVIKVKSDEGQAGVLESVLTVTYADDGSFVITGTVQKFNESFTGDLIISVPVNITCDASGNYSDGGEFAGSNPAIEGVKINFANLKNYTTPDSTLLNASVAKADTASVFGVAYEYDVTLVVNKNESSITSVALSYANVTLTCEYK